MIDEDYEVNIDSMLKSGKSCKEILDEVTSELLQQKNELETIFHTSKDGIAILDLETNFLSFNDAYLKMTGFTKQELLTKSCVNLSLPEDIPKAEDAVKIAIETGFFENLEKTCVVKDDKHVVVNMSIALMKDEKRLLIATKDVTEAKKIEIQLHNYLELMDKNIITTKTNLHGVVTEVSSAMCRVTGYTKEELIGQPLNILRHPDMSSKAFKDLWKAISNDEEYTFEVKNLKKDKSCYWCEVNASPLYNSDDIKIGYTAIYKDITDKKNVEKLSITDGLTNIFNRRYFDEKFNSVIQSGKRKDELISFIILDVDYFKEYNDKYGHQEGDKVLINIAELLKNSLHRADDYCFRLGGEEFAILYKSNSVDSSKTFARKINKAVEALKIEHEKSPVSPFITVSSGLVCDKASNIDDTENVYKKADDLLYKAKENGRNRLEC